MLEEETFFLLDIYLQRQQRGKRFALIKVALKKSHTECCFSLYFKAGVIWSSLKEKGGKKKTNNPAQPLHGGCECRATIKQHPGQLLFLCAHCGGTGCTWYCEGNIAGTSERGLCCLGARSWLSALWGCKLSLP